MSSGDVTDSPSKWQGAKSKGWNFIEHSISLSDCKDIANEVMRYGREIDAMPFTVAILDNGGHLKYFERQNGSGLLRYEIAVGKANTALTLGFSSRDITKNLEARPYFMNALSVASNGKAMFAPGGILLKKNNVVVGAIGVSGDTSLRDEYCAIMAAQKCGYQTSPARPADEVLKSNL